MGKRDSRQWYNLCDAVLRGIAANHNNVDFMLHYSYRYANQNRMSQLTHKWLKNSEVVQRGMESYFISKPPTPTGEVVCVVCQPLCTVQVTFIFVHRNTCECVKCTCMYTSTYVCACVHAVLMYMCACSTHVHVCMQYSCICVHAVLMSCVHAVLMSCVHAVLMYMCACSTHVMCACSTHVMCHVKETL